MNIEIPNEWQPRGYQIPCWKYLESGGRRAVLVWHRRSGKDSLALNWAASAAHRRVGTYWHLLPTQKQARKVIWEAINPDNGKRVIDQVFPPEIRKPGGEGKREDEMLLRLRVGSNWQLAGSDNYNSLVGSNVLGVVFSEWSLCDPHAWDYISPILIENNGWAMFIYTPRGRNHGYDWLNKHKPIETSYVSLLTVDDTKREDGTPVIAPSQIDEERLEGKSEEMIQQEYYCSFDAPLQGAYFSNQIQKMQKEGRITKVPYDPKIRVETWWDLGMNDSTSIGFVQRVNKEIRLIDYYENSGESLEHYVKVLDDRGYLYSEHILPHDVDVRELGTGKSRKEVLRGLGVNVKIAPNLPVLDGINAVRQMLPMVWMDEKKCERWLEALKQYRKEWDDKNKIYHNRPLHDWSSHAADMTRYGAVSRPKAAQVKRSPQPKYKTL